MQRASARLFMSRGSFGIPTERRCHGKSILFKKIVVASRGEAACRIIQSCRRLGIKTVSIYSKYDQDALHVRYADESVYMGDQSDLGCYTDEEGILTAVQLTGADAIHPSYGELSKRPDFIRKLEGKEISFIGPSADIVEKMNNEDITDKIAKSLELKTLPSHSADITTEEELIAITQKMEYPVRIRVGRGKGNFERIVKGNKEATEAYKKGREEASKSKEEDKRIFIQKVIEHPRYIDVQVLGDSLGNSITLNERETSLEVGNKAFITEMPSPFVRPRLRRELTEQSLKLTKELNYNSVGSVRFLVDEKSVPHRFYFHSMTPSLDINDSLSEMVHGIDLVEQMVSIAAGNSLTISQEEIFADAKWAIACHLEADEGLKEKEVVRISSYEEPLQFSGAVRVNSAVATGSPVTAKIPELLQLITVKEDRVQAIDAMKNALDSLKLEGVSHNAYLVRSIMNNTRFMAGDLHANFFTEEYPDGFILRLTDKEITHLLAVAVLLSYENASRQTLADDTFQPVDHLVLEFEGQEYIGKFNASEEQVKITGGDIDPVILSVNYQWKFGHLTVETMIDGEFTSTKVLATNYDGFLLRYNCVPFDVKVFTPLQDKLRRKIQVATKE